MSTFLVWHDGVALRIYSGDIDIVNEPIEVSLHSSSYTPDTAHDEQGDLSGELTGAGYSRQTLVSVTYDDTSDVGAVEAIIGAADSTWPSGTYSGAADTAVWSIISTGEVIAHAGLVGTVSGTTGLDPSAGGLRVEWGPVVVDPEPPPVGGRGATDPTVGMGWSPARPPGSTSVPAGLTEWATYIGSPARAVVTFAHFGQGSTLTSQQSAINQATNPNLSSHQTAGHPDVMHVLKILLVRKGVGDTLASVANGAYGSHWQDVGGILHANGFDTLLTGNLRNILVPGWEANGSWYAWYLANDPGAYRDAFDLAISEMAVGGLDLDGVDAEYCLNTRGNASRAQVTAAWPTAATAVGFDVYDIEKSSCLSSHHNPPRSAYSGHLTDKASQWDRNWQVGQAGQPVTSNDTLVGLYWGLEQAQQRDIYFTMSEWAPLTGTDRVGGDNWHMARDAYLFLEEAAATGRLLYHTYSDYLAIDEDSRVRGGSLPLFQAEFLDRFAL